MEHNRWSTIVQKLGGQIFVLTTVLKFSRPVSIKKTVILNMKKTWVLLRVSRVGCVDSHAQT